MRRHGARYPRRLGVSALGSLRVLPSQLCPEGIPFHETLGGWVRIARRFLAITAVATILGALFFASGALAGDRVYVQACGYQLKSWAWQSDT